MTRQRGEYDLVVIGGGSAGLTAAAFAGRVRARVLLVDRERLGGDCLWAGCVPSKALIRCATVAHTARRSEDYGVLADPTVDFPGAMAHVRRAMERIAVRESPDALGARGAEAAFGGARFLGPRRLLVGEREVTGRAVIIATGARPSPPAIPGLAEAGYLDHVSLWSLTELPRRLAVVGGGPVGVEMAQAFARLGSQVTLVERGERLLPRDDAELTGLLRGYLEEEVTVLCGAAVVGARRRGAEKVLAVRTADAEYELACDEVLVATGRRPAVEGLDLEAAGVLATGRGIKVDASLRTSAAGVFACGDCTGGPQFTHVAEAQGRVATRNALFRGRARFARTLAWTTFTDPELAQVGRTEAQARRQDAAVRVYRFEYGDLDRAVCDGETRGRAKLVCDRRGRILGGSLLGARAGEAAGELAVAIDAGLSIRRLGASIHVYPTFSRIVRRLSDQAFVDDGISPLTGRLFGRFRGWLAPALASHWAQVSAGWARPPDRRSRGGDGLA
ncbi:MAG: FAD-dependent oxidoreductase, partial [Thermoleophilia bacterium]